jgi:hypothetical protein
VDRQYKEKALPLGGVFPVWAASRKKKVPQDNSCGTFIKSS